MYKQKGQLSTEKFDWTYMMEQLKYKFYLRKMKHGKIFCILLRGKYYSSESFYCIGGLFSP